MSGHLPSESCNTLEAIHVNGHYTEHPHIASELNTASHHLWRWWCCVAHHKAEISTKFQCASQYSMSICLTGSVMNKTLHKTQLKTPPTVSVWIKDNCNYCTTCFRWDCRILDCNYANPPFQAIKTIWGHWKAYYQFRNYTLASFFPQRSSSDSNSINADMIG